MDKEEDNNPKFVNYLDKEENNPKYAKYLDKEEKNYLRKTTVVKMLKASRHFLRLSSS